MAFTVTSPVAAYVIGDFGAYALFSVDPSTDPPTIRPAGYIVVNIVTGDVVGFAYDLKSACDIANDAVEQQAPKPRAPGMR